MVRIIVLVFAVAAFNIQSCQSRLLCDLREADGIKCDCYDHEAHCEATRPLKYLLAGFRHDDSTQLLKRRREANPTISTLMLQSPQNESFLQTIPSDIFGGSLNFVKVKIAYASLNVLKKGAVSGSKILRELTMNLCGISGLEKEAIDGLLNLQELNFSSNPLTTLKANTLTNLPSLKRLVISHSDLATIESHAFVHLSALEKLILKDNHLTDVDMLYFTGLKAIQEIDLSFNYISKIDEGAFANLQTLKRLDLTANQLVVIGQKHFELMPNLEFLSLHHNSLTSLAPGFLKDSPKLRELNLARNHLSVLPYETLDGLKAIRSNFILDIRMNPLNCSCELYYLHELRRKRLAVSENEFGEPKEFESLQCRVRIATFIEPKQLLEYFVDKNCPEHPAINDLNALPINENLESSSPLIRESLAILTWMTSLSLVYSVWRSI